MSKEDPPRDAGLPPGYDEEDPYADVDLSTFPEWWRHNIEEFRSHGMRPYRPPRFACGSLVPERLETLADELDIEIRFRAVNPQTGVPWQLVVDGEPIEEVEHARVGEGYTEYGITANRFEELVRQAVGR